LPPRPHQRLDAAGVAQKNPLPRRLDGAGFSGRAQFVVGPAGCARLPAAMAGRPELGGSRRFVSGELAGLLQLLRAL